MIQNSQASGGGGGGLGALASVAALLPVLPEEPGLFNRIQNYTMSFVLFDELLHTVSSKLSD